MIQCHSLNIPVGKKVLFDLRFAKCCANCKYCISQTPIDDPTQYACGRLSRPESEPPAVYGPDSSANRNKRTRIHLWWARNYVVAGGVCREFSQSLLPKMFSEYEDDVTREADRKG